MKVAFYNAGGDFNIVLADRMIRSVRHAMPGVEIVQLSNMEGNRIWGVDDIRRLPNEPLTIITAKHYSLLTGDWLTLDTDMIVQKDVSHVFDDVFDVAFATRDGTYAVTGKEAETKFIHDMPYNIGISFTKTPHFWEETVKRLYLESPEVQRWMGNQIVAAKIIRDNMFNVKIIPSTYNYPPRMRYEDVSDKHILHYKGKRKNWMFMDRFYE